MKKKITYSQLLAYISSSKLFVPLQMGKKLLVLKFVSTDKNFCIPIRENYSKDYLEKLFVKANAIDMPFHLLWLYIEVL